MVLVLQCSAPGGDGEVPPEAEPPPQGLHRRTHIYQQPTTGGSWLQTHVERGFVACKYSPKHVFEHTCHVDSPRTASILLLRRRRYTLGTRVGYLGVDKWAGVTRKYCVTHVVQLPADRISGAWSVESGDITAIRESAHAPQFLLQTRASYSKL